MQISLRLKLTDFLEHESILIPMIGEISKAPKLGKKPLILLRKGSVNL